MALAEQKARTLRRAVVNKAKNYTPIETKVREATSNDPWGPEASILAEIADASYNVVAFGEIMGVLWKRLNDDGKNWRHVMKSLSVLEALVKTGSEKCADQCRKNIYAIETLSSFRHIDKEGKDNGHVVREKAKHLVLLLKDEERLKSERAKCLKLREKMSGTTVWAVSSNGHTSAPHQPDWRPSYPTGAYSEAGATSSVPANLSTELEGALPSDATEEELQLQLALALSKEEAEKEESQRKNAEIKLKMALQESVKEQKQQPAPPPADPWGGGSANNDPFGSASVTKQRSEPVVNDPWGDFSSQVASSNQSSFFDTQSGGSMNTSNMGGAFSSSSSSLPPPLMPMGDAPADLMGNGGDQASVAASNERPSSPSKLAAQKLLGDHAQLVNLDALISPSSRPVQQPGSVFPTNPFQPGDPAASAAPARGNPFQPKVAQPTINQLRGSSNESSAAAAAFGQPPAANQMSPMMQFNHQPPPVVPPFPQFAQQPASQAPSYNPFL